MVEELKTSLVMLIGDNGETFNGNALEKSYKAGLDFGREVRLEIQM